MPSRTWTNQPGNELRLGFFWVSPLLILLLLLVYSILCVVLIAVAVAADDDWLHSVARTLISMELCSSRARTGQFMG